MKENNNNTFRSILKVLRIVFYLCFAFYIYLRFKTGEYISIPLVIWILILPEGIYNILTIRQQYQGNDADKKKLKSIFIKSILLALIITSIVIIVAVLQAT